MVGVGGGGGGCYSAAMISVQILRQTKQHLAIIIQLSMKFEIDFICILPFRLNLSVTR